MSALGGILDIYSILAQKLVIVEAGHDLVFLVSHTSVRDVFVRNYW